MTSSSIGNFFNSDDYSHLELRHCNIRREGAFYDMEGLNEFYELEAIALSVLDWQKYDKTSKAIKLYMNEGRLIRKVQTQLLPLFQLPSSVAEIDSQNAYLKMQKTAKSIARTLDSLWFYYVKTEKREKPYQEELAVLMHHLFWEPYRKYLKETEEAISKGEVTQPFEQFLSELRRPERISQEFSSLLLDAIVDPQKAKALDLIVKNAGSYYQIVREKLFKHYSDPDNTLVVRILMLAGGFLPSQIEPTLQTAIFPSLNTKTANESHYRNPWIHNVAARSFVIMMRKKADEILENCSLDHPSSSEDPCKIAKELVSKLEQFAEEIVAKIDADLIGAFRIERNGESQIYSSIDRYAEGLAYLHQLFEGKLQDTRWFASPLLDPFFKKLMASNDPFNPADFQLEISDVVTGVLWNGFDQQLTVFNKKQQAANPQASPLKLSAHDSYTVLVDGFANKISLALRLPVDKVKETLAPSKFLESPAQAHRHFFDRLKLLLSEKTGAQDDALTNKTIATIEYLQSFLDPGFYSTIPSTFLFPAIQSFLDRHSKLVNRPASERAEEKQPIDLETSEEGQAAIASAETTVTEMVSAILEPSQPTSSNANNAVEATQVGETLEQLRQQFNERARADLLHLLAHDPLVKPEVAEAFKNDPSLWDPAVINNSVYLDGERFDAIRRKAREISQREIVQEGLEQFRAAIAKDVESHAIIVSDNIISRRYEDFFKLARKAKNYLTPQEKATFQQECQKITRQALLRQQIQMESNLKHTTGFFIENQLLKALGKGSIDDEITRELRNRAELDVLKTLLQGEGLELGSVAKMQATVNRHKLIARLKSAGFTDEADLAKVVVMIEELNRLYVSMLEAAAPHKEHVKNLPLKFPDNVRDFVISSKANMVDNKVERMVREMITGNANRIKTSLETRTEAQIRNWVETNGRSEINKVRSGEAFTAIDRALATDIAFYQKWGPKIGQRLIQGQYDSNEALGEGVCFGLTIRWTLARMINSTLKPGEYKITMKDRFRQMIHSFSTGTQAVFKIWNGHEDPAITSSFPTSLRKEAGIKNISKVLDLKNQTKTSSDFKNKLLQTPSPLPKGNGTAMIALSMASGGHAIGITYQPDRNEFYIADPNVGEIKLDSSDEFFECFQDLIRTHYSDIKAIRGFILEPK